MYRYVLTQILNKFFTFFFRLVRDRHGRYAARGRPGQIPVTGPEHIFSYICISKKPFILNCPTMSQWNYRCEAEGGNTGQGSV